MTTEPELFSRIQSTYNYTPEEKLTKPSESNFISAMIKVPLLIIDDVGKEERNDPKFVQRILFEIINGRYDNMLPMVLTANLSPEELSEHLGGNRDNDASFNRLKQMANFIPMEGKSYREEIHD
jgi:DNA replication protein DnaC